MLTKIQYCFVFFAIIIFASCDSKRVFEENKEIPDGIWNRSNMVSLETQITDINQAYNVYINIRNAGTYQFNNVFIFFTTHFPNGKMSKDTVECVIADQTGKWLGSGLGDIWDNQILFKKNVRFPIAGKYNFDFEQGMRDDNLPFIMDVGMRIEKASK